MIYESPEYLSAPDDIYTHALVIGCGYPKLPSDVDVYSLLRGAKDGSLTTPWFSVERFPDWLMCQGDFAPKTKPGAGFNNGKAKLGTVEFLASVDKQYTFPNASAPTDLVAPTCDVIQTAFRGWMARVGKQDDNLGIFYFCGHGLMDGEDHILLADGFDGENDPNDGPWVEAFNMTDSVDAATTKVKGSLYFFVDACMEFDGDVVLTSNPPRTLVHWNKGDSVTAKDHIYLRGTKAGQQAFGRTDGVANFTQALVKVLSGFCGRTAVGKLDYRVSWPLLVQATTALLARTMQDSNDMQDVGVVASGNGRTILRTLDKAPNVILGLDVEPPGYRGQVTMWVDNPKLPKRIEETLTSSHKDLEVTQDIYQIGLKPSPGATFSAKEVRDVLLLPPVEEKTFDIP